MPCVTINVVPPAGTEEEEKPQYKTGEYLGILFIILAIAIAIYIRRR